MLPGPRSPHPCPREGLQSLVLFVLNSKLIQISNFKTKPWFPHAISNEVGHRSISIEPEQRCLYTRLYLTLGNRGFPFWAPVSPSEWLMAGSILPRLHGLSLIKVLCLALPVPIPAGRTAADPTTSCLSGPGGIDKLVALGAEICAGLLWHQLESVLLLSGLSSEMLLWAGVRAAE